MYFPYTYSKKVTNLERDTKKVYICNIGIIKIFLFIANIESDIKKVYIYRIGIADV